MWTLRAVAAVLILAGGAMAQTEAHPEFEVASIKPAAPDARGMFIRPGPGGGISITNMTLKEMIVIAWRVQPFQISGGPSWLDAVHYDITAKPEAKTTQTELSLMLQALLKDRFQLAIHMETKELRSMRWCWRERTASWEPGLRNRRKAAVFRPILRNPRPRWDGAGVRRSRAVGR